MLSYRYFDMHDLGGYCPHFCLLECSVKVINSRTSASIVYSSVLASSRELVAKDTPTLESLSVQGICKCKIVCCPYLRGVEPFI